MASSWLYMCTVMLISFSQTIIITIQKNLILLQEGDSEGNNENMVDIATCLFFL